MGVASAEDTTLLRSLEGDGENLQSPLSRRCFRKPWFWRCWELNRKPPRPVRMPAPGCVDAGDTKAIVECVFLDSAYASLWTSGWVEAVVWCESRWVPTAVSPLGHLGLFQIAPQWFDGRWASLEGPWSDPQKNAEAAIHILGVQGRGAWSCSPW